MEEFFWAAVPVIWSGVGGVALTVITSLGKKGHKFLSEHEANNQVAAEHAGLKKKVAELEKSNQLLIQGLRTVIKADMEVEHKRLVHQHYATLPEKDHFEEMYKAYASLGGNGTGKSMYEDVMGMYTMAPHGEERK